MPKTKIDPRSAIKKAKDAAYAKLGPAKIVKPLRYIRDCCPDTRVTDPLGKLLGYKASIEYATARQAADRGNGAFVQTQARLIALA